ncbi:uncharacterized protein YjiS (DUF1127 family) [Rhizobium mesoamericanum]|uniref:DUF1127 domain-containing protein n=1 Tax=Rhizobium mesoamericanum TaxID=1079800 RepID=UPI0027814DDC|nr:DUF1127 domain-containing protein [Rhizobium mesoamericanum]MDQ0558444.1 uncharacterized protein YjiS (DUF1127 family) [Rhizobium mesoamericanum]
MSAVQENEPQIAPLSSQVQSMQYRVSERSDVLIYTWSVLQFLWQRLSLWHEKRQSRRTLLNLTDDELLDVGITRADARKEASKSFFWD